MEQKQYSDLFELIQQDQKAEQFYNSLPGYVKEQMATRAQGVNSYESLCHYAENLTKGDD